MYLLTNTAGTLTPKRSNSNEYGFPVHDGQGLAALDGGGFLSQKPPCSSYLPKMSHYFTEGNACSARDKKAGKAVTHVSTSRVSFQWLLRRRAS